MLRRRHHGWRKLGVSLYELSLDCIPSTTVRTSPLLRFPAIASNFRSFRQDSPIRCIRRSYTTSSSWGRNQYLDAFDPLRTSQPDPSQRLQGDGAEEIKSHPFFPQHVGFEGLLQKSIQPPCKSNVSGSVDVSNLDTMLSAEEPTDSVVEGSQLNQTVQARFAGSLFLFFHFGLPAMLTLPDIGVLLRRREDAM